MAISFDLMEENPKSIRSKRGIPFYLTSEGKVALVFLKMHTELSAPKLLEAIHEEP